MSNENFVQRNSNAGPIDLIQLCIVMFGTFSAVFLCCEFGQMVANHFDLFHNELCQCDWYLSPIEIQRMLLIFMVSTQQPAIFHGYGRIEGSRDTFKTVNAILYFICIDLVDMKSDFKTRQRRNIDFYFFFSFSCLFVRQLTADFRILCRFDKLVDKFNLFYFNLLKI